MSTHDYVIANASGSSVRSDLNNALAAIVSNNSSSSEPSTKYAYMLWVDSTNNLIKLRNSANNAWITLFTTTGGLSISAASTFNEDVTFDGATAGRDMVWDRSDNALEFADNAKCTFGAGPDLSIFHDADSSYIEHTTSGTDLIIDAKSPGDDLILRAADDVEIRVQGNESAIKCIGNGAVELYWDNSKRIEATEYGAKISSNLSAGYLEVSTSASGGDGHVEVIGGEGGAAILSLTADEGDDNPDRWRFAANADGTFTLKNKTSGSWENTIKATGDGNVELYFNNGKVFETGPNANNVRVSGYFEAFWDQADAEYVYNGSSYAFHKAQTSIAGWVMSVENSNDSQPYGFLIKFSDAAPDNNTEQAIFFADNAATRFIVYSDGDAWTSDAGTLSSDRTLKENITDATSKLEDIKKLKVRNFNWKASYHPEKSKKKQIGFIAQEVEEVFPSLVNEYDISPDAADKDHTPVMKKAIKAAWDPIIIKAMQELITKVETLETKVAALEG